VRAVLAIVVLVGVVFGITFISQYSPRKKKDDGNGSSADGRGGNEDKTVLTFIKSIRVWDPRSPDPLDHLFPGYFEVGPTVHHASYWFENRHPSPVTMQLQAAMVQVPAGAKLLGGRMAPVPPEVTDQLMMTAIVSGLPQGLASGLPLNFAACAANLDPSPSNPRLQWQEYRLGSNPRPEYKIPAAPGAARLFPYQLGIFELLFEVDMPQRNSISGGFDLRLDGTEITEKATLSVGFEGAEPFEVFPQSVPVGDLTDTTEPRSFNVLAYSSTRKAGPPGAGTGLAKPEIEIIGPGGRTDSFVTYSDLTQVPDSGLMSIAIQVSTIEKKPIRVESAYVCTVTVRPKVDKDLLAMGPLERDIRFTVPGVKEPKAVRIKGMVYGPVRLDNKRTDIEIPSYRAAEGLATHYRLITDHPDAVVTLIPDECRPKSVGYKLTKLPPDPDRGYYDLTVEIPRDGMTGAWSGVIVLELQGERRQKMRIPIRGVAKF
jgi:hypothetical protein